MPVSRRDEIKKRLIVRSLLSEWYGSERAGVESTAYTPDAVRVGDLAEEFLKKAASAEVLDGIRLREAWQSIAGAQIAAVSELINLRDGVAEVGVFHSAWLRELRGPVKQQMLRKINQALGEERCRDIRFVPGERRKP